MIHIHLHHPAFRSEHEARLCRMAEFERSPQHAHEAMSSYEQMRDNNDLVAARAQFDNPEMRRLYPEMEGKRPLDRAFFTSLLLSNALPEKRAGYNDIERKQINIADPFGLAKKTNKEVGEWLDKNVNPEILKQIEDVPKPTDPAELDKWHKRMGQLYKIHMNRANLAWQDTGKLEDSVVARIPLERYQVIRKDVDALLKKVGIRVPGIELDKSDLGDKNLTRREYLTLLSFVWNDQTILPKLEAEARAGGIDNVRQLINVQSTAPSAVDKVYIDLSLEELGPSEALNNLGVTIPSDLRENYRKALTNDPDKEKIIETPAGPVIQENPPLSIKPEDSAAVWGKFPERAFPFLSTYMAVPGNGNMQFIDALEYHFVLTQAERDGTPAEERPKLDKDDTRAMVIAISQMLLESQQVLDKSNEQHVGFLNKLTFAEKAENEVGNMFEYMKDLRSHPIGSSLAWIVAIGGAVAAYRYLKKGPSLRTVVLGGAAMGGLAYGLYQQHTKGEAWWETVWNKANTWMGNERTKNPTEQTLPNYWAEQLSMDSNQERVMLSVLSRGKVGDIMDWYGQMRAWKQRGSPAGESQPELKLDMDPRLDKYFGNVTWDQRGEMFYTMTGKFLADRGRSVKEEYPDYARTLKIEDDEALGYAYMKERYIEQKYFKSMFSGIVHIGDIEIEGSALIDEDDNNPELSKILAQYPDMRGRILRIRKQYFLEEKTRRSADWDMSTVFLLEANPETLRLMGRDGTEAASYLDTLYTKAREAIEYPFKEGPPERARKEDLFSGAEESLMATLGKRFLQKNDPTASATAAEMMQEFDAFMANIQLPDSVKQAMRARLTLTPPAGMLEGIERARFEMLATKDWNEYLTRLPVDADGFKKLTAFMPEFLVTNSKRSQVETLNEIERIKYQLLVLAAQKETLLDASVIDKLDPKNDTTWNLLLDKTIDWVWFDQTTFPKMENLDGLQSLFGSEAYQQGGVDWYNVLARAFPRWKESDFKYLRAQVATYQDALNRLRISPVIEPGKAPLDPAQIDAIEMQLARRMANRTLEALLLTHGRGKTPDLKGQHTVSPLEQKNLREYNDALFQEILGKKPADIQPNVKLPTMLENINNYVWNQLSADVMVATKKGTDTVKYYVLDPTRTFWVEQGFPWITENLDKLNIKIGEGIIYSEKKISEFIVYISPIAEQFKDDTIKFFKEGANYVVEWTVASTGAVMKFSAEKIEDLRVLIERAVAEAHNVPKDKSGAYVRKLDELRKTVPGMFAQVKNGVVEVAVVPDTWTNRLEASATNPALTALLATTAGAGTGFGALGLGGYSGAGIGAVSMGGGTYAGEQFNSANTLAFMTPMTSLDLYSPLQFTVDNFLADKRTPEELAKDWLNRVITLRNGSLSTKFGLSGSNVIRIKTGTAGLPYIEVGVGGFGDDKRAEISPAVFTAITDDDIVSRYNTWMKKTLVEKAANRKM